MTTRTEVALPPIAGYHPTTLIDWPGRLAAIIFLPRCNLRCRFCHAGPLLADPAEVIPLEAVLDSLVSRQGWLDGVVVCGGEPTLWPGLAELCRRLRAVGGPGAPARPGDGGAAGAGPAPLPVKLDTNGTRPEVLESLLAEGLVEAVSMDLKAPLDGRYARVCGVPRVDLDALRRSIRLLLDSKVEVEFRTTVVPGLVGEEEIQAMGPAIAGAPLWTLQPFEPAHALDPALRRVPPYPPERMAALADLARRYVARCRVRGQATSGAAGPAQTAPSG